jgi:hypothetical protein
MYLVLEYDLVGDYLERRAQFREEHLGLARRRTSGVSSPWPAR